MSQKGHMEKGIETIPKMNPFKVPENYFDSFQEHMAEKIIREQRKKAHSTAQVWDIRHLIPVFASAAVVILIVTGIFWFKQSSKSVVTTPGEMAEIYSYSTLSEMSDSELMYQLVQIHEEKTATTDTLSRKKNDSTKETMEYLSSEDIGMDELINAL